MGSRSGAHSDRDGGSIRRRPRATRASCGRPLAPLIDLKQDPAEGSRHRAPDAFVVELCPALPKRWAAKAEQIWREHGTA
jgi:hypothetical protein